MDRTFTAAGAVTAGLGIAAGAFGAHLLRGRLDPASLALWETAARYQMYGALGMLAAAAAMPHLAPRLVRGGGWLFVAGTVVFSGSLYALALTGARSLGAITPLGGLCHLAAWACLATAALRSR
jgi:uncharacterized membrane protein YgdD (TMEM256/DUF423 family)